MKLGRFLVLILSILFLGSFNAYAADLHHKNEIGKKVGNRQYPCPVCAQKKLKRSFLPSGLEIKNIEKQFNYVYQSVGKAHLQNNIPKHQEVSESAKKLFVEKYIFLDGYYVRGLKPKNYCGRDGNAIIGRVGVRFSWQLSHSISLWGDIFAGVGHQSFAHSDIDKGWGDIRYLYLSTKSVYEPDYFGYYASIGRLPVIEKRGFWFYNYLDGAKIGYKSTLLHWFLFAGTRLEDFRISNSDEKTNIQGYDYFIGYADYQYFYKQHIGLFYISERKNKFSNLNDVSVWKGVRDKENINWAGLRLKGDVFLRNTDTRYWLDIGYMWGKRGFANTKFNGCTAYKSTVYTEYKKERGLGLDLGGKALFGKTGIGLRFAMGQGVNTLKRGKEFYLPRISNERERMFGLNRIRYYGELTNPDLNNLFILSVFGGYEFYENNWFEINVLKYLQYHTSKSLSFGRYFVSPNGNSRDIGYETDVMLDGEIKTDSNKWRYLITGSVFLPGEAFNGLLDRRVAYGIFLKIKRYW